MRVRAAVLHEIGLPQPYRLSQPLVIEEVELAAPQAGEVLVRIHAAGICHSDLSVINGDRPRPTPMALGHEAAGVVVSLGAGVDDLKSGDHVVLVFMPSCGHCEPCSIGRPALCEPGALANGAGTLLSGERRLSRNGVPLHHHLGCAAFAEYAVVSRRSCVEIDTRLPFDVAALFGCAVLTGTGAVINTARVEAGSRVAVVGLGGVGLSAVLAALASGARDVIAIDVLESKLDFARSIGATLVVNAKDPDGIQKVKHATRGGVDYAFEMAGAVAALEFAYDITRRGGTTVTAGLPHARDTWPLRPVSLIAEERTVKGSYIGSCVPARDIPRYIALYQQGRLPVDRLLSERIALEDVNDAMDRLASGQSIRQVIVTEACA